MLGGGMHKSAAVWRNVLGRAGFGVPVAWLVLAAGAVHGQAAVTGAEGKAFTKLWVEMIQNSRSFLPRNSARDRP